MTYLRENIQGEVGSRFTVSKARKVNRTRRNSRTEHTTVKGTGCSNGIDERSREYDVTLVWVQKLGIRHTGQHVTEIAISGAQ